MVKYTVEVSSRAEKTYATICESAIGRLKAGDVSHPSVELCRTLDGLIGVVHSNPFQRHRLVGHLSLVYWLWMGRLRIFYTASHKPKTVVILCISTKRETAPDVLADQLILQLIREGRIKLPKPKSAYLH